MKKKFFQVFALLTIVLMSAVTVTSCSDDNDGPSDSIVGKWVLTQTDIEDDGTYSVTMTLVLNSNKTGYIAENWSSSTKASSSEDYRMDFSWATSTDSDGNDILKVSYVSGDKNTELFPGENVVLWQRQYVHTGNILNIYQGSGVWVFNKK